METKICTACRESKPVAAFAKNKRGALGLRSHCRACISVYNHKYHTKRWAEDADFRARVCAQSLKWTKDNPEARAVIAARRNKREMLLFPERVRCRALVNQRVRHGRMPRACDQKCVKCSAQAAHYHHHLGYSFEHRYDVIPLCVACHVEEDRASKS